MRKRSTPNGVETVKILCRQPGVASTTQIKSRTGYLPPPPPPNPPLLYCSVLLLPGASDPALEDDPPALSSSQLSHHC